MQILRALGSWIVFAGLGMLCQEPPLCFGSEDVEVLALPVVPSRSLPPWEVEGRGRRLVIFSEKVDVTYDSFFSPSNLQTRCFSFSAMDTHGLHFHPSGSCGCTNVV